ncbi:MAG: acylneuraminate cytidylyltransferase family protein, partial [Chloroflexi bacterium]|nr:acylneuraminate cytidylyltransferase family protein [Chloroflexota bacterium]
MASSGSTRASSRSGPSSAVSAEEPASALDAKAGEAGPERSERASPERSERVLCIIPARGGSKRLPRKNLALLLGEPLVAHSIRHALEARLVQRVVVSTDDAEIASVAEQHGAEVVRRPAEIAGDTATSESALLHVLDHLERTESYHPDLVVFLQCTSPVRQRDDIDNAIRALLD